MAFNWRKVLAFDLASTDMAIWDRLKKKKKPAVSEERKELAQAAEKREKGEKPTESAREAIEHSDRISVVGVIRRPHVTEKASGVAKENKYVFVVTPARNKIEIKRAVESRYGVEVLAVNILNMPGKERKRGRQIGWRPGYKKAVVTLKEGQSIEIQ